ncbi:DKNYY domain-containing protein [Oceanobacter mangrovi]|uniref:DKNYY domain-containing protein n=1 Tax=Oceanobacter mangrovi TaxID=2862510 RepID=UPI001C8D2719|nr:DKNYY domain-containing protein [Oceanobacter mangrovi]
MVIQSIVLVLVIALLTGCATNRSVSREKYHYYKILPDKVVWVERKAFGSNKNPFDVHLYIADSASFSTMGQKYYGKDDKHVYYRGHIIPLADPATFRLLAKNYGADSNRVYIEKKIIEGADPATTVIVQGSKHLEYAKDASNVYVNEKPLNPCDLATFRAIEEKSFNWSRDDRCVYYDEHTLPNVDASNFRFVKYKYATDGERVYYADKLLTEANAASFKYERKGNYDATDGQNCFMTGKPVACDSSKKITDVTRMSYDQIEASAMRVARKWLADDRNAQSEAARNSAITQNLVVSNYPGNLLTPEKVSALSISQLPNQFRFLTALTYSSLKPDENLYVLDKNNPETAVLSIHNNEDWIVKQEFLDPKTGFLRSKSRIDGYGQEIIYLGGPCKFTIGACSETIKNNENGVTISESKIDYQVEFMDGVWSMAFEQGGRKKRYFNIYDENGFRIYHAYFSEGEMMEEHVRVFDSVNGWMNLTGR